MTLHIISQNQIQAIAELLLKDTNFADHAKENPFKIDLPEVLSVDSYYLQIQCNKYVDFVNTKTNSLDFSYDIETNEIIEYEEESDNIFKLSEGNFVAHEIDWRESEYSEKLFLEFMGFDTQNGFWTEDIDNYKNKNPLAHQAFVGI